jgi:hypothetical protein
MRNRHNFAKKQKEKWPSPAADRTRDVVSLAHPLDAGVTPTHYESVVILHAMELESTFPAMRPPSDEQQAIVAQFQAPPDARARMVCVTAGAGAGKITTLLHLAKECDRLGHTHVTYLTFNRAAAEDTKRRITKVLPGFQLDARTIHSASRAALALHRQALEV